MYCYAFACDWLACSSEPPSAPHARTLILGNLVLVDARDSDRILIQIDDITVQPTRDHLWSAPLTENGYPALVRALGQDLDKLSDQIASQIKTTPIQH